MTNDNPVPGVVGYLLIFQYEYHYDIKMLFLYINNSDNRTEQYQICNIFELGTVPNHPQILLNLTTPTSRIFWYVRTRSCRALGRFSVGMIISRRRNWLSLVIIYLYRNKSDQANKTNTTRANNISIRYLPVVRIDHCTAQQHSICTLHVKPDKY